MLEIYKDIKIEEEVIIVERQNEEHQGYLVSMNNQKQLENALNWANISVYDESLRQKYYDTKDEKYWKQYRASEKEVKGIVHTYKNGQFRLTLCESAERSWSQSGKLSFWNCLITCPDNKTFLIGINSDCLLSLLKNTDFIKGVCQSNLWLGRIKNNVGAFTDDMDEFKDGIKDKEMREAKQTANYNSLGQIIKTKSDAFCYLGEWYKHFSIYRNDSYRKSDKYPDFFMVVYSKPKKVYGYESILHYDKTQSTEEDVNKCSLSSWNFNTTKKKGILTDECYAVDFNKILNNTRNERNKQVSEWNTGEFDPYRVLHCYKQEEYKCPTELKEGNVFIKCYNKDEHSDISTLVKAFKDRGGIVFYDLDIPKEDISDSWSYGLNERI